MSNDTTAMHKALGRLAGMPKWLLLVLGVIAVLSLGLIDYLTGPEIALSLFYLLPISVITYAVGSGAGVSISVASAVTWLVADLAGSSPDARHIIRYWNGLVGLGFFLIVVYLLSGWKLNKEEKERALRDRMSALADEIAERTRAEQTIRASHEQLRQLAASIEAAREQERIRVAREIHDVLGQTLTGLKIDLSWLESRLPPLEKALRQRIEEMKESSDQMLGAVRKISTELRPAVLDHFGLVAALSWQTQEFQERTGIRSSFASATEDVELDEDRTTAMFRIFLEALTNVTRHAGATELLINLTQEGSSLILTIDDNGRGITEGQITDSKSIGLLGMRERADLLGGRVEFRGSPGKGTMVTITMPVTKTADTNDQSAHR